MGLMTSWAWYDDPKRLTFMVSRYKFVSKMLTNLKLVAEVGCETDLVQELFWKRTKVGLL